MRVSDQFQLGRSQPVLDFVDVDTSTDLELFIDPFVLRTKPGSFAEECSALIQDYFQSILSSVRTAKHRRAQTLLAMLSEPNEVHLGLSKGSSRGHGLGRELATTIWEGMKASEAVRTGLLRDLEDALLLVEGIGPDILSDMVVNIIRAPLIAYTQKMANLYGIPLSQGVYSGPLWDPELGDWREDFVCLPMTPEGRLLLVPKGIVRQRMHYDLGQYFHHYILRAMQDREINTGSEIVGIVKGQPRVTKKALKAKYGSSKRLIVEETLKNPDTLEWYRDDRQLAGSTPLSQAAILSMEALELPDWDSLLASLVEIEAGRDDAAEYERAAEALLTALFYPNLVEPELQTRLHNGRKRVDITYVNMGENGFFAWLSRHYTTPYLFVECKNYTGEVENPGLDQLSSRFSPRRGEIGFLVARSFDDKELFVQRCRDTANDGRGFVMVLDDEDLKTLVEARKLGGENWDLQPLKERFNKLVL